MSLLLSSLTQALFWSIMAIGVFITFRLVDIADLSAEGSFPLGAALAAYLIISGMSPLLASLLACLGGGLAGLLAGILHTKMKIPAIITGILVQTGLYSINIRVMGQSNLSLLAEPTLIRSLEGLKLPAPLAALILALLVVSLVIIALVYFMKTECGLALRTTGDNPIMAEANGIHTDHMIILAYVISNALIALSGAMIAQFNGYADISMGTGTIVIGLASLIIAEVILKHTTLFGRLISIIGGAFIYRLAIDLILRQTVISITPTDIKIISAIILALILWLPQFKSKRKKASKKNQVEGSSI